MIECRRRYHTSPVIRYIAKDKKEMNFTRIEYFLVAAEYLNFTRAANVLYITQPSLSKQIAHLEEELGVLLFERRPRDIQLTPAGQLLYHEFNKLMPEIDVITEKVKRLSDEERDVLYVGSIETVFLGEAATKVVSEFSSKEPDVELYIERHSFEELHNRIINGKIDVAFTFSNQIGKMKDIMCSEVEPRNRHIIMSKKHKLASLEDVGIEDLRGETFVLHNQADPMALCDDILEECGNLGFYPKIRYASTLDALLDYLELAGCVAFLDKSITEIRHGKLKCCPTKQEKPFSLVCIWNKNNKNPALEEFTKYLTNAPVLLNRNEVQTQE